MRRALALLFLFSGCTNEITDALLHPPAVAGGELSVALDDGRPAMATALAQANAEPFLVSAYSGDLVVGMKLGSTALGNTAITLLTGPGTSADFAIDPTGVTQLQVHVAGKSCVAASGLISVEVMDDHKLHGSFTAEGTVMGQSGRCKVAGTLKGIPIERPR